MVWTNPNSCIFENSQQPQYKTEPTVTKKDRNRCLHEKKKFYPLNFTKMYIIGVKFYKKYGKNVTK